MVSYYNEIDPYAAQWLRNLITNKLIADGDVDERSIRDVAAADLRSYTQCHFFAGIGVWSHALRLAGWPDDRPVWTGSCPCQPFSAAGQGKGFDDDRHLWPEFYRLIAECAPPVVFGEQVASKDGLGWIDIVHADLEATGYAVGAADLCAAGVGAPHIRQRLWFVGERLADAECGQRGSVGLCGLRQVDGSEGSRAAAEFAGSRDDGGLADAGNDGSQGRIRGRPDEGRETLDGSAGRDGADRELANAPFDGRRQRVEDGERLRSGDSTEGTAGRPAIDSNVSGRLEHTSSIGRERGQTPAPGHDDDGSTPGGAEGQHGVGLAGPHRLHQDGARPTDGHWRDADWLHCRDGKFRPVEPGTFPLVNGAPARVGRLRAYGNAIVPQVAAEVIGAYLDARP